MNSNFNYEISHDHKVTEMKKIISILALTAIVLNSMISFAQNDTIQSSDTIKTIVYVFDIDKDIRKEYNRSSLNYTEKKKYRNLE